MNICLFFVVLVCSIRFSDGSVLKTIFNKPEPNSDELIFTKENLNSSKLHQNDNDQKPVLLTKKLPQAIIIGAKKCGTRALLKFIGAHPNVSAAGAEIHFFDRFYHMGYDWYRNQMPYSNEHQITVEKTPKYLVDKRVAHRVFKMNAHIKLIVVLRNPVTRAISEYVQSQANKKKRNIVQRANTFNDSMRFQQMLYETVNMTKEIKTSWPIVRNGVYIEHIKHWLKFFPIEQFLFVNGEELIKDPSSEIDKVQEFLGLSKAIKREHFVHNKRKGFACIVKPIDSTQVKCLSDEKGRIHPTIDPNVINDLSNYYRPYNDMLFSMLNRTQLWPI